MSQGLDDDLTCIAEDIYFFYIPLSASLVDLGKARRGFLMGSCYDAFSTPVPGQVIKAAVHNCRPVGV